MPSESVATICTNESAFPVPRSHVIGIDIGDLLRSAVAYQQFKFTLQDFQHAVYPGFAERAQTVMILPFGRGSPDFAGLVFLNLNQLATSIVRLIAPFAR